MKLVVKSYKIRIYPKMSLQDNFRENFGYNRFVFNQLLGNNNLIYRLVLNNPRINPNNYKPSINRVITNNWLKSFKESFPFLKNGESTCLQSTCDIYIDSFKRFFKKQSSYPKFKSKKNPVQSIKLKNNKSSIRFEDKRIRLNKFGFVRYRDNRKIKGDILSAAVKFENNRWYVVINCKNVPVEHFPKTGSIIGIDLGLKDLMIFSDGEKRKPIKRLANIESKIARLNQNLSRKNKGSKNFKKNVKQLNKLYSRVVDIRNDEYQKLSTEIVRCFDFIALETLQPINMVKNSRLSHSISQISWSKLVDMIKYKAEWYGKIMVQVDRFFPSSKLCSHCGYKNEGLTLNIRNWTCPDCGSVHDRDVNAALNILKEANRICTPGTGGIKACATMDSLEPFKQESPAS
ncbi:MAG: RNA-guided endonuclease TnpB family protein [Methanobacterium sp.]